MTRSVLCEWNPFRTYSTTLKVLEWNVVHRDMISMKASVVCTWKCSICMSISGCNCSVQINWKMAATDHPGAFEYFPMRFYSPLFSSQEENLTTPFEWSEDDGSNVVNFVIHFFFFFWFLFFVSGEIIHGAPDDEVGGATSEFRDFPTKKKRKCSWIIGNRNRSGTSPEYFRRQMALATHPSIAKFFQKNHRGCHLMSI